MDIQLKILKYPIENYNGKLWYPNENADTQFTEKVMGIYPMSSNSYLELSGHRVSIIVFIIYWSVPSCILLYQENMVY